MKPIIRVDNLWKRYRIGTTDAAYATFRESLTRAVTNSSSRIARSTARHTRCLPEKTQRHSGARGT